MISKNDQKRLKKLLGHTYSREVSAILKKKRIVNKFGKPHTSEYIRMVFQGYRENSAIEQAIIELAIERKKELDKIKRRKIDLFG
jgi:hypothetical protein